MDKTKHIDIQIDSLSKDMDGYVDIQLESVLNGWMNGRTDRWTGGRKDRWTGEWMDGRTDDL